MPRYVDFRTKSQVTLNDVNHSGQNIGRTIYWKLYAIENYYRIIIHSILSSQINTNWWFIATDSTIQRKARNFRINYRRRPWHSSPGRHDIYYINLADLNEITRINSHLFIPVIVDIDQWILKIEMLKLPRNIVAHMNFPNQADRQRIYILFHDFEVLMRILQSQASITLQAPK